MNKKNICLVLLGVIFIILGASCQLNNTMIMVLMGLSISILGVIKQMYDNIMQKLK